VKDMIMKKTQRANQIVANLLKEVSSKKKEIAATAFYNPKVIQVVKRLMPIVDDMLGLADFASNGMSGGTHVVINKGDGVYFEGYRLSGSDYGRVCIFSDETLTHIKKIYANKIPEGYMWAFAVMPRGKDVLAGIYVYNGGGEDTPEE